MRTLFLVPPPLRSGPTNRDVLYGGWCKGKRIGGGTLPPLILLNVATLCKQSGLDVTLLDAQGEGVSPEAVAARAPEFDHVVILCSTMSIQDDVRVVEQMKWVNPRLRSIWLGSDPSFLPELCLEYAAVDILVRLEPDFIVKELLERLEQGGDGWGAQLGISYRSADGIVHNNPDRPFPTDQHLSDYPFSDRTMLPKGVTYDNPIVRRYPYATSLTSRGCPAQCTFCQSPAFLGAGMRAWPAEKLVEEAEMLLGLGYRTIYYRDETFTWDPRRMRRFSDLVVERRLRFDWLGNARANTADLPLLERMRAAGCTVLKIGVESGDDELLRRMKKGLTVRNTREFFANCHKAGIAPHAHIMFGVPGETRETLKRTIDFIFEIEPATLDIGLMMPYPGSEIFEEYKALLDVSRLHEDLNFGELHITTAFDRVWTEVPAAELHELQKATYRRFYLRPCYIMKSLASLESIAALPRLAVSGFNVLRFALSGDRGELRADLPVTKVSLRGVVGTSPVVGPPVGKPRVGAVATQRADA
jgi:radical SAM superfamily enzyme YgiQ (UPF0313 family)